MHRHFTHFWGGGMTYGMKNTVDITKGTEKEQTLKIICVWHILCISNIILYDFPGNKFYVLMWFWFLSFFRIQQVGNEAYVLGLSSFHIPSIGAACVCFLELLGLDSLKLRVDMKVANTILSYKCKNEDTQYSFIRETLGINLYFRRFYLRGRDE